MGEIIGVMAGTPVDTKMGVDLLINRGFKAKGYPMARNPKEQSRMQLLSKEELYERVLVTLKKARGKGIEKFFVYCNSLSAAVDMDRVSRETDSLIITPFTAYYDLAKDFSTLLILAANGQACAKIETILEEANEGIRIWSLSALPLVEEIEKATPPRVIYHKLALEKIVGWAEEMDVEGILLGCTHFPYLIDVLTRNTRIPIIDPAERMIEKLRK